MGLLAKKWKSDDGEVVVRRKKFKKFKEDSSGTGGWSYSFEGWDAPSKDSAIEFLNYKKFKKMNHYVIVRAPNKIVETKFIDIHFGEHLYGPDRMKFSSLPYGWVKETINTNFLLKIEFMYKHLEKVIKVKKKIKKIACVHCGDTKDEFLTMPGFQVFDVSTEKAYAQCSNCKQSISHGLTTEELLLKIRSYPKTQRTKGTV